MKLGIWIASVAMVVAMPATAQKGYKAAKTAKDVGYRSTTGTDGRITIVYTGARGAKPDQVAKFAMLRAAELTKEAGMTWFAVISAQTSDLANGTGSSLRDKTGPDFATGSTSAASGAAGQAGSSPGVSDGAVPTGPTTGGFGGGDVPYQVLERWRPSQTAQSVVVIQPGSGDNAAFPGLTQQPTIYSADDVIEQVRGTR
ncbi:CC0125/CC1285 family lipoprotein [Sphingomonas kyungheensis]|uniref:Uncharacterized protein n=1 Tax=Sphingomonas kyungheensis TaxID=1069987 RepID=A0ABU8H633_9SPHN